MQARGSIVIACTPDEAFAFVADAANDLAWRSYLVASHGRATAVGDIVMQRYSAEGRSFEVRLEVSEYQPPGRLSYIIHEPTRVRVAFQFRPEGEGTRVSVTLSSILTGTATLFEARIQSEGDRIVHTDLQRLKMALESRQHPRV